MGEHKRKQQPQQPPPGAPPELLERLSRELADKGLLIEAGWMALRTAAVPPDTPAWQLEEMRASFFAGAQHLFSSIRTIMDEDREPTEADMRRMDLIDRELKIFVAAYEKRHGLAGREQ